MHSQFFSHSYNCTLCVLHLSQLHNLILKWKPPSSELQSGRCANSYSKARNGLHDNSSAPVNSIASPLANQYYSFFFLSVETSEQIMQLYQWRETAYKGRKRLEFRTTASNKSIFCSCTLILLILFKKERWKDKIINFMSIFKNGKSKTKEVVYLW